MKRLLMLATAGVLVLGLGGAMPRLDDAGVSAGQVRSNAPGSVDIKVAGYRYRVQVSAWRDFMPIAPPGGRAMTAFVGITPLDRGAPMVTPVVTFAQGRLRWTPVLERDRIEPDALLPYYSFTGRNGPKLVVNSVMDARVELRVGRRTATGLARGVRIGATR